MTSEKLSKATTKNLIRRLFEALEIVRVISVDDDHAEGSSQSKEEVFGAIQAESIDLALVARTVLPDEEESAEFGLSVDEVRELVDQNWDKLSDEARSRLTQAARRAESAQEGSVDMQSSSVSDNNAALLALPEILEDSVEFHSMGLTDWRSSGYELLEDRRPTLVLFDRSFEREGGSETAGDELIRSLLSREDLDYVHVGLLTHTASDLGRETEIANSISDNFDARRPVIVIAKSRLQDGTFAEALRVVLYASEIEEFRNHVANSLSRATEEAVNHLRQVDKYLLFASIEAARCEGTYEPENATRIADAIFRRSLAKSLRQKEFITDVMTRLRRGGGVRLYLDSSEKPPALTEAEWDERFECEKMLSSLALPIEVGDIFKVHDLHRARAIKKGVDRYYVLLAQECDLSVRGDGKRSNDLTRVMLTQLSPIDVNREDGPRPLKENQVEFGALHKTSSDPWMVEFTKQITVPTLALDACVISGTGKATLDLKTQAPPELPESWSTRCGKMRDEADRLIRNYQQMEQAFLSNQTGEMRKRVDRAAKFVTAALLGTATKHSDGLTAKIDVKSARIEFGLERYARLVDGSARGLLSRLLQHQMRPASEGKLFYDGAEGV